MPHHRRQSVFRVLSNMLQAERLFGFLVVFSMHSGMSHEVATPGWDMLKLLHGLLAESRPTKQITAIQQTVDFLASEVPRADAAMDGSEEEEEARVRSLRSYLYGIALVQRPVKGGSS